MKKKNLLTDKDGCGNFFFSSFVEPVYKLTPKLKIFWMWAVDEKKKKNNNQQKQQQQHTNRETNVVADRTNK